VVAAFCHRQPFGPRRGRAPIGQQRPRRLRVRRVRPSSVRLLTEIRGLIEHQHAELMGELRALLQQRRDEYEIPAAVLRRVTEIERHLRLVETPAMPRINRRRPLD
jgi:hypothetical protein